MNFASTNQLQHLSVRNDIYMITAQRGDSWTGTRFVLLWWFVIEFYVRNARCWLNDQRCFHWIIKIMQILLLFWRNSERLAQFVGWILPFWFRIQVKFTFQSLKPAINGCHTVHIIHFYWWISLWFKHFHVNLS